MRQYIVIFLVCFLCLFFLGTGIFGVNGYLYNQDLRRQIALAEYNKDKLNVEINSLKEQKSHLSSEEGLRDLAIDLGYYVEGDTVYLFDEPSLQEYSNNESSDDNSNRYIPLSSGTIIVIDLGVSFIITFIICFFSRNKKTKNYYGGDDDISDLDIYINA